MDNSQREIRNEIEATRQDMVEKIATLESRVDSTIQGVKRSVDPKYQTQQHPWLMIGLSIAVGYVFSGLILGRPAPKAKLVLPDDWNERFPAKQRNTGMLQSLTGMLSGVVTATAVSLARDFASRTLFKSSSNGHGNGRDPNAPTNGEQRMTTYSR